MVDRLPLIDVSELPRSTTDPGVGPAERSVAAAIDDACRRYGFFRVIGHGLDPERLARLDGAARAFFALPTADKERVAMRHGGRAWRGWFPPGGELTAGRPDQKEGLYFGTELSADHPAVVASLPLHGPNLFPDAPSDLRPAVLGWMPAMTDLGHRLLRAVAVGLGLEPSWFRRTVTADPTVLFRIFRYPPSEGDGWGVAEHTDYGLLTLLAQDGLGGLEVRGPDGWLAVPADPDVLVVNLGDMLERMTGGRYRSTPHRVRNAAGQDRLSFPTFVDPSWDAVCPVMPLAGGEPDAGGDRWDGADPRAWTGTYGDYLTAKVAKVFPQLRNEIDRAG
jgi:isopenicillin N synthase-like dioxygenase